MCGLVGVFGSYNCKMQGVFKDLLAIDVVRGAHSTGAGFVPHSDKHNSYLLKDAVLPQVLMEDSNFKKGVSQSNLLKMGHNRLATVGKVNKDNAHPFYFEGQLGRILGAHNGTLRNKWELERETGEKFETDSQAFFSLISDKGLGEAWKLMQGAAAVSLYEIDNRTLTLATNGERPLSYAILPTKRQVVWASEAWMIRAACYRRQVEIDRVVTIDKNKGVLFWMKGEVVKHQIFKLEPRPFVHRPPGHGHMGGGLGYYYGQEESDLKEWYVWDTGLNEWVRKEKKGGVTTSTPVGKQIPSFGTKFDDPVFRDGVDKKDFTDHWGNYSSVVLDEQCFHDLYHNCSLCYKSLIDEYGEAMIIDESRAICSECYQDCENNNYDPGRAAI